MTTRPSAVPLHCDQGGTGAPPLLLVHGWGGDAGEWAPHLAAWSRRHRVLAPDLRGHGRSLAPAGGAYGPRDFAADLAALLHRLDTGPVVAVGHSMGGQAVTALAVEHPALVRAVVVLDPAYGADDAELARLPAEQEALRAEGAAWAVRFVRGAFGPHTPPEVRARHERLMAAMDPDVLARCRDGMYLAPDAFGARAAARAYLARRRCPVLGVYSNEAAADWERASLTHPYSRIEAWPGCGHYLHEDRREALVELVEEWTAGLDEPGATTYL
ncbi:putative hydrolase [Streptomyces bingchenggensis BCW-1]|uniref:Putative hydrolase n=1 Tax=Streptomyces bingchenggensis (strain BCW-1) TaxID=749414 RepID=D7CFQ9_STRBB|nr:MULTISPECIES: alpha/beta hydrolase [Streptomyces]ADI04795.1 putative hydrolase [Streptomyces bingchenggensis BCW-1]